MKYIVFFALMIVTAFPVAAQLDPALKAKKAERFVQQLADSAIQALNDTQGDEDARRVEFQKILKSNFDMDTIARFAMGRYWAAATDAEKRQYKDLFRAMVVDVYTRRFSEYDNQVLEVTGSRPAGRRDMIVNGVVTGGGQPIKVDWRIRNGKVIDVIVEGVSMSVTQRNDFASIIQRNGGQVAALISHLQK